jgi:hypothetical protein
MCAARAYRSTALERPNGHGDHVDLGDVLGADDPAYELVEHRPALAAALARQDERSRDCPAAVLPRSFSASPTFGLNPCRSNMERWLVTQGQRIERPSAALSHLSGSLAAY